jgi:hypothetical protein
MDAQKLVRQKSLTLKRIKALQDLVADNDQMKSDAEIVYLKYENRLRALEGEEHGVINTLKSRLEELDSQAASIKTVVFDAKLQYRSNDMTEETYQQVNMNANELLEHTNLEKEEISNFLTRISQHTVDDIELTSELEVQDDKYNHTTDTNSNKYVRQEDNMDLENGRLLATNTADKDGPKEESAVAIGSDSDSEVNWLNEVIAKEIKDDQ